jgi:hypothetical protein
MLKCSAKTLEDEDVEFEISELSSTFPDDDVAYIRTAFGGVYAVKLSSILAVSEDGE